MGTDLSIRRAKRRGDMTPVVRMSAKSKASGLDKTQKSSVQDSNGLIQADQSAGEGAVPLTLQKRIPTIKNVRFVR